MFRRVVVAAVFALLALPSVASAAGFEWNKPIVVSQPPFQQPGSLNAISCPSASFCLAVDQTGGIVRSANPGAAQPAWTQATVDPVEACPTIAHVHCAPALNAVSCPSTSLCAVVDGLGNVFVSINPTAADPTWTMTDIDSPIPLVGISCASASLCVAIEASGRELTSTNPTAANPLWLIGAVDPFEQMSGISCPTTSLCVAVDLDGGAVVSTNPGARQWAPRTAISDAYLRGVSCTAAPLCVAVGYTEPGGFAHGYTLVSANPGAGTWKSTEIAQSTLWGVSCTGSGMCATTDNYYGTIWISSAPAAAAPVWTSTAPDDPNPFAAVSCATSNLCVGISGARAAATTNPTAASPTWALTAVDGRNAVNDVTCVSTAFCVAIDGAGNTLTSVDSGATWATSKIDANELTAISCPSTSLCAAGDGIGNVLISTNPTAAHPTWVMKNISGGTPIWGVACVSTALCVAIDQGGETLTSTNPTSVLSVWDIAVVGGRFAISCPSATLCASVGNEDVFVTTAPAALPASWHAMQLTSLRSIFGISCPSAALCVAGDVDGQVWVSTNPAGAEPAWLAPAGIGEQALGVSCPSTAWCAVVGTRGTSVVSADPADTYPSWTPVSSPTLSGLGSVSCLSASLCVAVTSAGEIMTGHWVGPLPAPPVASAPPTVSGDPTIGMTLTAAHATWTNDPWQKLWQWLRCDGAGNGCAEVGGSDTYALVTDDLGHTIRVRETATSIGGTGAPSTSAPTAVVQDVPTATPTPAETPTPTPTPSPTPTPTPSPSPSPSPSPTATALPTVSATPTPMPTPAATATVAPITHPAAAPKLKLVRAAVSGKAARATVSCTGNAGTTCAVSVTLTAKRGNKTIAAGTAKMTLATGHSATVRVTLNAAARKLLKAQRRVKMTLTVAHAGHATVTFKG